MRKHQAAPFSGIGRRVTLAVAVSCLLMLAVFTAFDAREYQRQFRAQRQQTVDLSASQAALSIRNRIGSAETCFARWSRVPSRKLAHTHRGCGHC